jgi:hypothetical protein
VSSVPLSATLVIPRYPVVSVSKPCKNVAKARPAPGRISAVANTTPSFCGCWGIVFSCFRCSSHVGRTQVGQHRKGQVVEDPRDSMGTLAEMTRGAPICHPANRRAWNSWRTAHRKMPDAEKQEWVSLFKRATVVGSNGRTRGRREIAAASKFSSRTAYNSGRRNRP